jgi:hypothetical protein
MSKLTRPLFLAGALALCAVSAPAATNANWFKIVSLTTNNAVFTEASLAGSLAASADHLFASRVGDAEFRRWDANGLANPTNFPSGFIVVSDLRTEKVYAFADADGTMTDQGTATALHELDPAMGQTNGVVIPLSSSVPVEDDCSLFGIFCGWGRVVVGGSQLSDIALPSGQVTALGMANPLKEGCESSEPLTGIAEFFGDELYLVAGKSFDGDKFQRVRLSNGARTTLATFNGMPQRTKLTFSPARNRWYFSTEGSWLGSSSSTVGYADATWDQSDEFPPPPPLTLTIPSPIPMNEDTTNDTLVTYTQSENAGFTWTFVVASSNPALLPTNAATFPSGGVEVGEAGDFILRIKPLLNQFGEATLTLLTTNQIGGRATNLVVVHVASVPDAPQAVMVQGFNGYAYFVAQAGAVIAASFVGSTLIATNGVVRQTNVFYVRDPDGHAAEPTFSFATDNPALLPLAGITLTPLGTNYQLVTEAAVDVLGKGRIYVTPTDADGLVGAALSFLFGEVKPTGVRRAETVLNTDFRVFAQGGLRNLGSLGTTTLSVTGLVGQVRQAWLYTHSIGTEPMLRWNGTNLFNLNTLTPNGEAVGYAADSCETTGQSVTRRFDLTGLLTTNGLYTLAKTNPFSSFSFSLNGISLLVFYDDGNATNNQDVTLFHGNDSTDDGQYDASDWQTRLQDVVYGGGPATLGLHVAYGEPIADAPIFVNGNLWQPQTNHFDGLTVPGRNDGTNGFFWDVREFDLAPLLNPGTNSLLFTMQRTTNTQDCLNLALATVAQPAAVTAPQPKLTIQSFGAGQYEISWSPATPGFSLQSTASLAPTNWTNAPSGTNNPATFPATLSARFYRLFKP